MRKKGHKKINPKNACYDHFYLVNYREFGKKWENRRKESLDFEDEELPHGFESDDGEGSDGNDDEWNDWNDTENAHPGAVCLFCPIIYPDMEELLMHMTSAHEFDFHHVRNSLKLDFYQQVKVVNFIRRKVQLKECLSCDHEAFKDQDELLEHMSSAEHMKLPDKSVWDLPNYFFPTYENDNFLSCLDDEVYDTNPPPVESEDIPVEMLSNSILSEKSFRDSVCPQKKRDGPRN